MKQKKVTISLPLKDKARFILWRLGYLDHNGKARGEHGTLTDYLNKLIINPFLNKDLETEWLKQQIIEKQKQVDNLRKDMVELAGKIERIKSIKNI